MSTWQSDPGSSTELSRPGALWFQFATPAVAWLMVNTLFCVIAWRACVHQEQFGGASPHPLARALYFLVWACSSGLAVFAGTISYRSWRKLSSTDKLIDAEGRDRKEFMSLAGLFFTLTLSCGFLWMCLPLFMLEMCVRTR